MALPVVQNSVGRACRSCSDQVCAASQSHLYGANRDSVSHCTGVNLARVPVGGRNFECVFACAQQLCARRALHEFIHTTCAGMLACRYMGEDPHLAAQMAAAETTGIQSEGVVACAKHWADNNQEGPGHNGRLSTSSLVDDRANFELYYRKCNLQPPIAISSAGLCCLRTQIHRPANGVR